MLEKWRAMLMTEKPTYEELEQRVKKLEKEAAERKMAEEDLQEAQSYLESLINYANVPIIVWDQQQRITLFNPAFEHLTGYTADEVVGGKVGIILPDERRNKSLKNVASTLAGEYWKSVEIPIACKDGDNRIALLNTANIYGDDGKTILATIAQSIDVTDCRRPEELIENYQFIVESAHDAIFFKDLGSRYLIINAKTAEAFGLPKEQIVGMNDYEIMPDKEEARKNVEDDQLVFKTGKPKEITKRMTGADGKEYWFQAIKVPKFDDKGNVVGLIGIARDITEQKLARKEKKQLEAKLQQAQKMETIGTLAGGIAHDFNNLLMGIQGCVSLMVLDIDSSHSFYEKLRNIEKQVKSGAKLTSQLLGYARKGRYEVKPVNLNQLVEEMSETFGRTRKEIAIRRDLAEDLFVTEVDQGQMEQVLLNLFVNASDAMPGGGDIILKAMNATHKNIKGTLYDPKPGGYVLLTVTDTGTGMDKSTVERIFDPFFTTKELGRGTGLGLSSVYGIIKAHGGYIDVESKKGVGSTFSIYLPVSEKKYRKVVKTPEEITKGTETVLLADDEEDILEVGQSLLKAMGYLVLVARDGHEAIKVYKKNRDDIDIVLLDMVMPNMGGGKAYDRMKKINPDIRVLLSSGYSVDGEAGEILKRGCNGFIQKPFDIKKLSAKLREILDEK
jgi:two-component system cell cycle sensor histidine kinase/response regulator CckA